jgi:hypothetical protein
MDNIFIDADRIGIRLGKKELEKRALALLIKKNRRVLVNDFINEFNDKMQLIKQKDNVLIQTQKYSAAVDEEEQVVKKINQLDQDIDDLKKYLDSLKIRQLEDLFMHTKTIENEIQKFNRISKLIFKKRFNSLEKQLASAEDKIFLFNSLSWLKERQKRLQKDLDSVYEKIDYSLLIPDDKYGYCRYKVSTEDVLDQLNEFHEYVANNKEKFNFVTGLLASKTCKE